MPTYEYQCEECEEEIIEKRFTLAEYQPKVVAECKRCEEETEHKRVLSKEGSFRMNFRRTSI